MSDKKQCEANSRNGERCKAYANGSGFCFMHDAAKGKERAEARQKGGSATKTPHFADESFLPSEVRTIEDVFAILNYAWQETVGLDNSINRGRLMVSIAHGFIEALRVGEFEKRLELVEMTLKIRKQNKNEYQKSQKRL